MAPPRPLAPVTPRVITISRPPDDPNGDATVIDWQTVEDLSRDFSHALLSDIQKINLDREKAIAFIGNIFRTYDVRFKTQASFHQTRLALKGSPALDLEEGAAVYFAGQAVDGFLASPYPMVLKGFSTLAGLVGLDRVETTPEGHVEISGLCHPFRQDITPWVMESPAGDVFPKGAVQPVLIEDLFRLFSEMMLSKNEFGEKLTTLAAESLEKVSLEADFFPNHFLENPPDSPGCDAPLAGIRLYLNLPVLQETLASGRFLQFDFSGIEKGSAFDWPDFPLSKLPLPEGLLIPGGTADLSGHYDPETKTTTLQVENLDVEVLVSNWFQNSPVHIEGNLSLVLHEGGLVSMDLKGLRFSFSAFPSERLPLGSMAGSLNGRASFQFTPEHGLALRDAEIIVDDFALTTAPGQEIRLGASGPQISTSLRGAFTMAYNAQFPEEPLRFEWDYQGQLSGRADHYELDIRNLQSRGAGGWKKIEGRYMPNIEDFHTTTAGDVALVTPKGNVFGRHLWVTVTGERGIHTSLDRIQEASIDIGGDSIDIGSFSFVPYAALHLMSQESEQHYILTGTGDWAIRSEAPLVEIGSDLSFDTDLSTLHWGLDFVRDQLLGPIAASGSLRAQGIGDFDLRNLSQLFQQFTLETITPYRLTYEDTLLASEARLSGQGNEQGFRIKMESPFLLGTSKGRLEIKKEAASSKITGRYDLRMPSVRMSPEASLGGLATSGSFALPPISTLVEKRALVVSGKAQGHLRGKAEGPLSVSYRTTIRLKPDKSALHLYLHPDSTLTFGPIGTPNDTPNKENTVDGIARLQGTLIVQKDPKGFKAHGYKVGIHDGAIYATLDGYRAQKDGQRIPAFFGTSLVIDWMSGIQGGILYSGGDGIRLDTEVDLNALHLGIDPSSSQQHISWIADRMALSTSGFWKMFKKLNDTLPPAGGTP